MVDKDSERVRELQDRVGDLKDEVTAATCWSNLALSPTPFGQVPLKKLCCACCNASWPLLPHRTSTIGDCYCSKRHQAVGFHVVVPDSRAPHVPFAVRPTGWPIRSLPAFLFNPTNLLFHFFSRRYSDWNTSTANWAAPTERLTSVRYYTMLPMMMTRI